MANWVLTGTAFRDKDQPLSGELDDTSGVSPGRRRSPVEMLHRTGGGHRSKECPTEAAIVPQKAAIAVDHGDVSIVFDVAGIKRDQVPWEAGYEWAAAPGEIEAARPSWAGSSADRCIFASLMLGPAAPA